MIASACDALHALIPQPALLPSSPPWTAKGGQGRERKGKVGVRWREQLHGTVLRDSISKALEVSRSSE